MILSEDFYCENDQRNKLKLTSNCFYLWTCLHIPIYGARRVLQEY